MAAIVVNGWTARSFIGDTPIEEFTQEELDIYFEKALDAAFLAIGYVPVIEKEENT